MIVRFLDVVTGHWPYAFTVLLLIIGLYGMLLKGNLIKKLIGMNIFQGAIILAYVVFAYKKDGSVPVIRFDEHHHAIEQASQYMNPIPHGLMLTAIVVGVATTGVGLALLILIHRNFGTLEEDELMEKLRRHD
jgi:multicomponent Na+:H+ antiporter subunit C